MIRERVGRYLIIATLALVSGMGLTAANAQDATPEDPGTEVTQLAVNTVLCDDASCAEGAWSSVDGAVISALDTESGDVISSCEVLATAAPEGCALDVPADDSLYTLSWDTSLIPEGYVQAGDPFIVEFAPVHPNVLTLAFAPEAADGDDGTPAATPVPDGDDDSAVTALPSTGTSDSGIDGGTMASAALASLAVVSLGAVGVILRRR
jgi:hypothetical protein